jgi:hypothetical protein
MTQDRQLKLVYSLHLVKARASGSFSLCLVHLHTLYQRTMNEILHKLRPQDAYRGEDGDGINSADVAGWGSHAGHGNLSRSGGIASMDVPRVHDVSFVCRRQCS